MNKWYLVDPVRVQHTQVGASSANTLFGNRSRVTRKLELRHTLVDRLTVDGTLWHRSLSVTTSHTDTVDHETLLGLVAETTGLVRSRWSRCSVNDVQLSMFPWISLSPKHVQTVKKGYLYSQHRTRNKNRSTSDCFFFWSSSRYL